MSRITKADIRAVLGRYIQAVESLGIQPPSGHRIEYREGSRNNGVSFKLVWVDEQGGYRGAPGTDSHGFLGMTHREAYTALLHIARAFQDAAYHISQ